jgi:aromatic-L-amino-acid decarboxylase
VEADPDFEIVAPVPLNLVCFRHRASDEANQAIMDRVNRSGRAFLSHTRLGDHLVLRLCVGQAHTEERHVRAVWELLKEAAVGVA